MNCLNCGAEMTNVQVVTKKNSISYDACQQCGSLWLDSGELDKMAFQVEGSIEYCEAEKDPQTEEQPKKCPRCDDSTLDKVKFLESDDLFLHRCANCGGFWLDSGQLNLIDKELSRIMPVNGHGFSDFVNNIHVPYWFQRVQKPSSETDVQVAVLPLKGAELKGTTPDRCPRCGAGLNQYSIFSMDFEGCPKCKGIWLIQDELRTLKNKVDEGYLRWMNDEIDNLEKSGAVSSNLLCPKCRTTNLVSVLFAHSKIVADWCPNCRGVWLDRGAFEGIVAYLDKERAETRPEVLEKQFAKDLRNVLAGAPEGRIEELRDAGSALHALLNAEIFEHPDLFRICMSLPR
jgi:Zn-finger nucleic acid-binding protein